jgi:catecholate siderophore receptor
MTSIRNLFGLLALGFAYCLTGPMSAFALEAQASPTSPAFRFDIRAGALDAALAQFEATTGLTVVIPVGVQGLASPGVTGTYSAGEALGRLLAGTGLSFRVSSANTYAIQVQPVVESVAVEASMPYRAIASTTAMRTLTPLRDVPQSLTVITAAVISDQRMQSMADVVRYAPGAGMGQGEGNRDTPILRGNSTTGDFFVDGIRDDVQYFRDLYNVERVEILKGPNAMMFGRGGAGGIINRATRQADWGTTREMTVQAGSHANRRLTFDVDQPVNQRVATRLTGVYENSNSYRRAVGLERYGFNPTVALALGAGTTIHVGYERFRDDRTADRGIPSMGNRPVETAASTFFGDPALSNTFVTVNALSSGVDHTLSRGIVLRNRIRFADYDKFYQNVYPGSAVSADGTSVSISAYNNATQRQNLFNQTDLNFAIDGGRVKHIVVVGAELGRQVTHNLRNTGYFTSIGPGATSLTVPVIAPTISSPVTFRQSASDASNRGIATVAGLFAQDQLEFSRHFEAVVGLRYDRFDVDFHNIRTTTDFASSDNLLSPRAGLIYKPIERVSVYTSYSLAYVPRAGDQLSSLSLTNQALEPERFTNKEIGVKWDMRRDLSLTTAVYRLERTNVAIPDPADASRSVLVDGQRTRGVELGVVGSIMQAWSVLGGYAYQDGRITQTLSASAPRGAVLAQLPTHTFSLWNRFDFGTRGGIGVGVIHNSDMFTSTDNTVVLPSFTRIDGAVFITVTRQLRAQVNIENVLDERYYAFSNGNNNIMPGAPRAARVSLITRF